MNTKNNAHLSSTPIPGSSILNKKPTTPVVGSAKGVNAYYFVDEAGGYFVKMKSTFTVPSIPTDTSGSYLILLWMGITGYKGGLLRPVLVFDSNRSTWYAQTMASATTGSGIPDQKGTAFDVSSGTELTGVIEFTGQTAAGQYNYKISFEGHPDETSCTQILDYPAIFSYLEIEPYSVTNQDQFPEEGSFDFTPIDVYTNHGQVTNPRWESDNPKVLISSNWVSLPYWNGLA
ncbi:hypothetical protein COMNV_00849 [Commensalibacter sp. Nvir]|uniref:hypothetical protein n=1 Tax=Commensalibacter sp. Nvir TaxID=3069817 RepID=UPI002D596C34|nr:hypothetical protein COMNV_00849 [Commensalibacter sp. Nvir]